MTRLFFTIAALIFVTSIFSQGNCDEADLQYISENLDLITELSTSCSNECLTDPDIESCVQQCIQDNTPLSVSCASCFGEQVSCAIDNCLILCLTQPESDCADCVASNCLEPFNECAGIVDADGDSFDTLFDCDDTNPAVYPGAPGTGEGIDNNCDGVISTEEELIFTGPCTGDLDGNLAVTVTDLSIFLSDFGCLEIDCIGNLDDVQGTTVGDLSILLSTFGTECF